MKKVIVLLLVVSMFMMCTACSSNNSDEKTTTSRSYETGNLEQIKNDIDANLARATETYVGSYYQFYVEFSSVTSDAKKIIAYGEIPSDSVIINSVRVDGTVVNKNAKDMVLSLNKGDIILVKGKITDLYYSMGYTVKMDIYEITIQYMG